MNWELSPKQTNKAIKKGENLYHLYTYQKLPSEQIDKAIEIGQYLDCLYEHQDCSKKAKKSLH